MRDRGRADHAGSLQLDLGVSEVVEQPLAAAEQHGHDAQLHLVDEPARRYCWTTVGAAADVHVLARRRRPRACSSAASMPSVTNVKRRAALHLERLARVVREHEDRVRGMAARRPTSRSSGSSPHGPSPRPNMLRPMIVAPMRIVSLDDLGVDAGLAAL